MSFIKTFSGKHFYYDRINKDDIDINDIAVSLSNICRFTEHARQIDSILNPSVPNLSQSKNKEGTNDV